MLLKRAVSASEVRPGRNHPDFALDRPEHPTNSEVYDRVPRIPVCGMNLEEYDNQDGMKVWLSEDEVQQLLDHYDDTERHIAIALGVRCGLRSEETIRVAPKHVVDTDAGVMLRV